MILSHVTTSCHSVNASRDSVKCISWDCHDSSLQSCIHVYALYTNYAYCIQGNTDYVYIICIHYTCTTKWYKQRTRHSWWEESVPDNLLHLLDNSTTLHLSTNITYPATPLISAYTTSPQIQSALHCLVMIPQIQIGNPHIKQCPYPSKHHPPAKHIYVCCSHISTQPTINQIYPIHFNLLKHTGAEAPPLILE